MEARKRLLTVKEAAAFLCCSEKTIRNRLSEIPHYNGPLGIRFKSEELESWACAVKCTPIKL